MYENWEILKKDCSTCNKCELSKTRTNVVFGSGDEKSKVLFIGEAPGENEDLQGAPFIGRGGKLLDEYLKSINLDREKIYIANIVKCRPDKNRDPKKSEQDACIDWLNEQIKIINPKIIVCLGRISSQKIIDKDFKVTKEHGQFIQKDGRLMMGTFHPASLLRNPRQKPLATEDFNNLREKINEVCEN